MYLLEGCNRHFKAAVFAEWCSLHASRATLRAYRQELKVNRMRIAGLALANNDRAILGQLVGAWWSASKHSGQERRLFESKVRSVGMALWSDRRGMLIQVLSAWRSTIAQSVKEHGLQQARARMVGFALWHNNRGVRTQVMQAWGSWSFFNLFFHSGIIFFAV